ncbi:MAG TPA: PEP-CTERM sorting domain-containing protein [Gemmatales bacterium]|nr:PEP-CTERM sorting domain-containing protein [Gemmatales bacterium]
MFRFMSLTAAAWLVLAGAAQAQVVVPNSAAGTDADGAFSLTSTATTGRTYQMTIAANQLTSLVGQQIVSLQWRLNGPATSAWPTATANYSFWDIFLGPGVSPSSMSNTFASNFSGSATQVRSGALSFDTGVFTSGSSPNAFGPALIFDTPYLYSGGDLNLEMRFAQQTGATTQSPLDAVTVSGGPGNGWGVDFAARWTGNSSGTTGANGNFLVTQLNIAAVPEPGTIALIGISTATLIIWGMRHRSKRNAEFNAPVKR